MIIDVGMLASLAHLAEKIAHAPGVVAAKRPRINSKPLARFHVAKISQFMVRQIDLGVVHHMKNGDVMLLMLKRLKGADDASRFIEQIADNDHHAARFDAVGKPQTDRRDIRGRTRFDGGKGVKNCPQVRPAAASRKVVVNLVVECNQSRHVILMNQ